MCVKKIRTNSLPPFYTPSLRVLEAVGNEYHDPHFYAKDHYFTYCNPFPPKSNTKLGNFQQSFFKTNSKVVNEDVGRRCFASPLIIGSVRNFPFPCVAGCVRPQRQPQTGHATAGRCACRRPLTGVAEGLGWGNNHLSTGGCFRGHILMGWAVLYWFMVITKVALMSFLIFHVLVILSKSLMLIEDVFKE